MFKKTLSIFFAAILGLSWVQAQHDHRWCGLSDQDARIIHERLLENKEALHQQPVVMRDVSYVPIKFHLIGKNDRTGMVPKHWVLDQLCLLNESFEELGLQFYIYNGFNYIFNDVAFSNHGATQNTVMTFNRSNAAINIFVPNDANPTGQGTVGNVLGYYNPTRDWLVIARGEIGKRKLTFIHEMGHFFSLNHPFFGWDAEPWEAESHGNPVTMNFAPNNFTRVELVDGSNCEIAGDGVCDTPADYLFGFGWNDCFFSLDVRDRNNEKLDPDERLWLNYFFNCSYDDYYFTDMQQALMIQDFNSQRRNYIRRDHVPTLTEITERPQAVAPANGTELGHFNGINLEWTPVPGAEAYLLQVGQISSFSALVVYDEVVYGTSKVIPDLIANRNYFWRVRPFSAYRTCTEFSTVASFRTGTLVNSWEEQLSTSLNVFPNPASSQQELSLSVVLEEGLEASLRLFNLAGQEVRQYGRHALRTGDNYLSLPLQGLVPGVYLLRMETAKGTVSRKVVVTK
jgi:hypothetical protein